MKDSYNYSGFSNVVIVSKKARKASSKHGLIIEADQLAADDPLKHCPPYLLQKDAEKNFYK